jgi:hypothetical protein
MLRTRGLLVTALAALWVCGCGQRPRLDVVPSLDEGRPVVTPLLGKYYGWDTAVIVACCVAAVGGALWLGIRPASSSVPSK